MSPATLNLVMQFLSSIEKGEPLSPSSFLPYLQKEMDKDTASNFINAVF